MSAVTNRNQLIFSRSVLSKCRGRDANGSNCSPKNDLEDCGHDSFLLRDHVNKTFVLLSDVTGDRIPSRQIPSRVIDFFAQLKSSVREKDSSLP